MIGDELIVIHIQPFLTSVGLLNIQKYVLTLTVPNLSDLSFDFIVVELTFIDHPGNH